MVAGGGGVAAGGGGVLGLGLLVKTGVALVAGLVATGIITDRSTPADAPHHEAAPAAASAGRVRVAHARPQLKVLAGGRLTGRRVVVEQMNALAGSGPAKSSGLLVSPQTAGTTAAASNAAPGSSLPASPLTSDPAPAATTQVADLVTTVESTASSSLPTVPVQPPTVPAPPVTVPQLPIGTPLP
jgi:hypothetical protein